MLESKYLRPGLAAAPEDRWGSVLVKWRLLKAKRGSFPLSKEKQTHSKWKDEDDATAVTGGAAGRIPPLKLLEGFGLFCEDGNFCRYVICLTPATLSAPVRL